MHGSTSSYKAITDYYVPLELITNSFIKSLCNNECYQSNVTLQHEECIVKLPIR